MKVGPEDRAEDADRNALRACSDAWARTDIYPCILQAQRAAAAGANTPAAPPMEGQPGFVPGTGKASLGVDDLKKLEGKVLPAPALGELESLMVCPPTVPAFDVFALALVSA